jgi:prephenate dehydratase
MVPGLQRYAMDSYISDVSEAPSHTTIIFTLTEEPGALAETLRIFKVGFGEKNFLVVKTVSLNLKGFAQRFFYECGLVRKLSVWASL